MAPTYIRLCGGNLFKKRLKKKNSKTYRYTLSSNCGKEGGGEMTVFDMDKNSMISEACVVDLVGGFLLTVSVPLLQYVVASVTVECAMGPAWA